jgi:hypothetical protein
VELERVRELRKYYEALIIDPEVAEALLQGDLDRKENQTDAGKKEAGPSAPKADYPFPKDYKGVDTGVQKAGPQSPTPQSLTSGGATPGTNKK